MINRRSLLLEMIDDAKDGATDIFEELTAMERVARDWAKSQGNDQHMVPGEVPLMAKMLADVIVLVEELVKREVERGAKA